MDLYYPTQKVDFSAKYCGLAIDRPYILWYHLLMDQSDIKDGDRIYWEITDSLGRIFHGIGRIGETISMERLEEIAKRLSKPVCIGIAKIDEGKEVHLLKDLSPNVSSVEAPSINN